MTDLIDPCGENNTDSVNLTESSVIEKIAGMITDYHHQSVGPKELIDHKNDKLELQSKRPLNKNLIQSYIMKEANVSYGDAKSMFDALLALIKHELSPSGSGKFTMPGVLTCQVSARNITAMNEGGKTPSLRVAIDKELRKYVSARDLKEYEHLRTQ